MSKDYYGMLGVNAAASTEQIREAFLVRAEQQLAVAGQSAAAGSGMVELCEAVEVLADPAKRALYDRHRSNPENAATREAFESAAAAAGARARTFAAKKGDARAWLDAEAVQQTRGGRIAAGLVAGILFGAISASLVGLFMALHIGYCALIGAAVGAGAGAFGAASNE